MMAIRRFIIEPPRDMTKESVTDSAEKLFTATKGIGIGVPVEKPLKPPEQAQDAAESVDAAEDVVLIDDNETHVDSVNKDGE